MSEETGKRTCKICSLPIPPNRRKGAVYCCSECSEKAKRDILFNKKRHKKAMQKAEKRVTEELSEQAFERMTDDTQLDMLRFCREVLKTAMADADTSPACLAGLCKQLIEVNSEITAINEAEAKSENVLESLSGGDIETPAEDEAFQGV